ncbi:hypothetical protein Taro_002915 [Colocasia esculenta]|uniref:Uncharacterized protein n=1 Tax=Colocasia esculenta TaxID=4460 RepID=A0A843TMC8_COLES|nr:hypothetical protein [Colocasia esculenta]
MCGAGWRYAARGDARRCAARDGDARRGVAMLGADVVEAPTPGVGMTMRRSETMAMHGAGTGDRGQRRWGCSASARRGFRGFANGEGKRSVEVRLRNGLLGISDPAYLSVSNVQEIANGQNHLNSSLCGPWMSWREDKGEQEFEAILSLKLVKQAINV